MNVVVSRRATMTATRCESFVVTRNGGRCRCIRHKGHDGSGVDMFALHQYDTIESRWVWPDADHGNFRAALR